jgi:homoserine O-acetyltransferase/O-succinyltransferase
MQPLTRWRTQHSAWCISWSEAQRQAILSDPLWLDGRYACTDCSGRETHAIHTERRVGRACRYSLDNPPVRGLAAARITAMLTYRSRDSFESRFGRKLQPEPRTTTTTASPAEASGPGGRYNPVQVRRSALGRAGAA